MYHILSIHNFHTYYPDYIDLQGTRSCTRHIETGVYVEFCMFSVSISTNDTTYFDIKRRIYLLIYNPAATNGLGVSQCILINKTIKCTVKIR